jgi:hypothetical protein
MPNEKGVRLGNIELRVRSKRFESWTAFQREAPEYSIALEVLDDVPGHRGHYVSFDHHAGVIREVTMSAAMQAYIAVRQGRIMERWLRHRNPIPVYVWNADQDVCLAAFVLAYHELLERAEGMPKLRWIVQYNNKIDICGGLYPVNLEDLVKNHFTWIFEPFHRQRMQGKTAGDAELVTSTIEQVCERLFDMMSDRAGRLPITVRPEVLYKSAHDYVIVDEKGDPNSRLVLASEGYRNLISLIARRPNGRFTYSVIRGCPYDEDTFQIDKLIAAFQAAEDEPEVWGGSNLAAGSDSEHGSRLTWQEIRDIAEPIVSEAALKSAALSAAPAVLVALPAGSRESLLSALEGAGARTICVDSCRDAMKAVDSGRNIAAIFTSPALPDGHCEGMLEALRRRAVNTPLIVCSQDMDGGWVDLLEAGAFRVMPQACDVQQVRSVLDSVLEAQPVAVG